MISPEHETIRAMVGPREEKNQLNEKQNKRYVLVTLNTMKPASELPVAC